MHTLRHVKGLMIAASLVSLAGSGVAGDAMGGMDRPYANGGNSFGHGAWGNGRGTAIPLPDPRAESGSYFEQGYDGGNNLFGTGFWSAEYMARRSETLSRHSSTDEAPYEGGPLGDDKAGDGGHGYDGGSMDGGVGHGHGMKDGHGKDGKDGYDKGHKNGHMPGGHDKGGDHQKGYDKGKSHGDYDKGDKHGGYDKHDKHDKHDKKMPKGMKEKYKEKTREVTRYIPYARTQYVESGRAYSQVIIVERQSQEIGDIRITGEVASRQQYHSETIGAICLTGKGDEIPALLTTDRGDDETYQGEIFRCPDNATLRVSYDTGAADMSNEVAVEDGSSYADCDAGEALVRTARGGLVCATKRPMSRSAERDLAGRYGDAEADIASSSYEDSYDDDREDGYGEEADLSGLQLTGGVGNTGGAY